MKNWKDYEKNIDLKTKYGANKENHKWVIRLWHPFAQKVNIVIYDAKDQHKEIKKVQGKFINPNWIWTLDENLDGFFYQYEIIQENGLVTRALDPYAKSMAAFDWEGTEKNVGKAAFVDFPKIKKLYKLNEINNPQPIIYEANVRDLTSLRKDVNIPGSFNAIKEINFAQHLKNLNITHAQFLPIHNCYTLNEKNKSILGKGEGLGWKTNYNWGYDPHNYFSINGWYSSDPENPYSRMYEFRELVKYMHSQDIKVINDVVYNHLYHNSILDNVIPGYYFRKDNYNKPVDQPAFASERKMARRLIIDSLKYFVEYYDVDGFRFDLSCFTDRETIKSIVKELRNIKPNIILHGEAWPWTDLPKNKWLIKGTQDNEYEFAYFNDTTRNAIKGEDDGTDFQSGLIAGNLKKFGSYLSSIIGNIKTFKQDIPEISIKPYDRFTKTPNVVLNYSACHDGHTIWDKINLTVKGDKNKKMEILRQSILMQQMLPGRTLYLEGTEMLYTKLNDHTGMDANRFHSSKYTIDIFGYGNNEYNENTYKSTDYTNGLRWGQLNNEIMQNIFNFISIVNKFRLSTKFFNVSTTKEINDSYKFNYISSKNGVIDFSISINNEKIRIIHNFKKKIYEYESNGKIFIDSKIIDKNILGKLLPNSSIMLKE